MLILTDEKKTESLDQKYNKKLDWFISSQPKSNVLEILLIIKAILRVNSDKEPARSEFEIIKAMWGKYRSDKKAKKMKKFENYVALARAYWKMQLEK